MFTTLGGDLVCLEPKAVGPGLRLSDHFPVPKSALAGRLFQLLMPLLRTASSSARLRMTSYRGVLSATMIYDHLPINDVFRQLDNDSVLGVMDFKGMEKPFFFRLRREGLSPSQSVTVL